MGSNVDWKFDPKSIIKSKNLSYNWLLILGAIPRPNLGSADLGSHDVYNDFFFIFLLFSRFYRYQIKNQAHPLGALRPPRGVGEAHLHQA